MSNRFGFTSGNDDDDPDKDRDNNQNNGSGDGASGNGNEGNTPFGGMPGFFSWSSDGGFQQGNLNDLFQQFSSMFGGENAQSGATPGFGMFGGQTPPPEAGADEDSPTLDRSIVSKAGIEEIGSERRPSDAETKAVTEAARLSDLWLDGVTDIPAAGGPVEAWNAAAWLDATIDTWIRLTAPVVENKDAASEAGLPEEAKQIIGPIKHMMNHFGHMQAATQLGGDLGELATQVLTGCDFGMPVAPRGTIAVLASHVSAAVKSLDIPEEEALMYITAREAARQRLFMHASWLPESIVGAVEEFALGLEIDNSEMEETIRDLQSGGIDPQQLLEHITNSDIEPRLFTRNEKSAELLETQIALVEGWVELVVHEALADRIPSALKMEEAWSRRFASGGSADTVLEEIVGITIKTPKVAAAYDLWRRVGEAVGQERRDSLWNHQDFLPRAEHLDNSAAFIDELLTDDFDPIAEITKLEESGNFGKGHEAHDGDEGSDGGDGNDSAGGSTNGDTDI